jgi:hypothetical protein
MSEHEEDPPKRPLDAERARLRDEGYTEAEIRPSARRARHPVIGRAPVRWRTEGENS